MAQLLELDIQPAVDIARVVVNARTGSVVVNQSVRLAPFAVTHGNLTIQVQATNQVVPQSLVSRNRPVNQRNERVSIDPGPAGQMVRGLGLAFASKLYRKLDGLKDMKDFSNNGNEVCFTTIGDASTSEGLFWETVNAAGVLRVPMAIFCWDDGYGISVPIEFQTTKSSISKALAGYQRTPTEKGLEIFQVKAWDYPGLIEAYQKAAKLAREEMVPCLVHVIECTQPQGHSASGSHERYKSADRLQFEHEATTSKISDEQLFYAMQRGLSAEVELVNEFDESGNIIYQD
jgi:transketolase